MDMRGSSGATREAWSLLGVDGFLSSKVEVHVGVWSVQKGNLTVQLQTEPIEEAKCSQCGQILDFRDIRPLSNILCPTCGAPKTVPGRFANYIVLELLGTGGMGAVYRGVDSLLDRPIALKVLLKSLRDKPELRERFRREAKAAANINHPNVTHVYAFGEQDGQPYIVMEYVHGKSLDSIMERQGPLDPAFVMETGRQVAAGLQAGSKIGLVHGDVKPENILYDSDYTAKLIDFGLASFVDEDVKGGVWGSPYYLSPERVQRQPTDERSDIYSLGATLYHALAGRPPFDGESTTEVLRARLERPPKPLTLVRREIPMSIARIVARMLAMDATKRYPNYPSLMADIEGVLQQLGCVRYPTARQVVRRTARPGKTVHPTTQRRRVVGVEPVAERKTTGPLGRERPSGGNVARRLAVGAVLLGLLAVGTLIFRQSARQPVQGTAPPFVQPPSVQRTVAPVLVLDPTRLIPCRGYGGMGTATVSGDGRSLTLKGSVWRAYPYAYFVTPRTVLEFDFSSVRPGALQGITLAGDTGARADRLIRLLGSRQTGMAHYPYTAAPRSQRYVVPVGQYVAGPVRFILFANDDNSEEQNADSTYSNLRIYER